MSGSTHGNHEALRFQTSLLRRGPGRRVEASGGRRPETRQATEGEGGIPARRVILELEKVNATNMTLATRGHGATDA